jgi:hypothetical protein
VEKEFKSKTKMCLTYINDERAKNTSKAIYESQNARQRRKLESKLRRRIWGNVQVEILEATSTFIFDLKTLLPKNRP